MPPVNHWPVSQPPIAIVAARNTITRTRPAVKASWASPADKSIAVRAGTETNGDRTGSRRSARMIRGPWARYAPTRASHRAASRTLSASGTACGVPSTGPAACHARDSPAMPRTMANRFGGTRGPANLRRPGLRSCCTIQGTDIRPPEVAALPVFPGCMPQGPARAGPALSSRRAWLSSRRAWVVLAPGLGCPGPR